MAGFDHIYAGLLKSPMVAPRGLVTREAIMISLVFDPNEEFITHSLFHDNSGYVRKEIEWYMKGKFQDLSIADEAKLWRDHITEGVLWSNYGGWLWGKTPGYRGFIHALKMVRHDRDTRRAIAYIGANDIVSKENKDVPCTNCMQFLVRENRLYTTVSMRSQDAYFGLRNDLPAFWFFAKVFGLLVDATPEAMKINIGSFHVYERCFDKIQAAILADEPIRLIPFDYGTRPEEFALELELML